RHGEREIYGYRGTEGFSTGIVTGPEMNSENLVFPLDAPASISGTVADEEGEPLRQANVTLFRKFVSMGRDEVSVIEQKGTGSSGRFRFAHLAPGTYFIGVQAQPWYAQPRQPGVPEAEGARELDVAYPVTYYGGTSDGAAATPITLAEGASTTIQIDLRAVPAVHVSLSGIDPSQGGVNAQVYSDGPGGSRIYASANVINANGSFELTGMAPGRYVVELQTYAQGRQQALARQTVDLTDGSTLSIQGAAPISVSGQVTFEGMEHPPNGAGVALSDGRESFNTGLEQDGSFSFSGRRTPSPGRYEVYVYNTPDGYVKSIAAKGAAVSGDTIQIADGGSVQLSIVAARGDRSNVNGITVKDGKPVAAAMILLLPQDLYRAAIIRRDQSDSDGTFTLPNAVPGRYTLLAIDDGSDLAYEDPAVIQAYLAGGQTIDVPLKDNAPVKVEVIGRKR